MVLWNEKDQHCVSEITFRVSVPQKSENLVLFLHINSSSNGKQGPQGNVCIVVGHPELTFT